MKKYLILLFITLCFSNVSVKSSADGIKEICEWIVIEAYPEVLQESPNNHFYVVVGSDGRCEYGVGFDEDSGFRDCEKWKKENNVNGECKPFAIGKEIVWKGQLVPTDIDLTSGGASILADLENEIISGSVEQTFNTSGSGSSSSCIKGDCENGLGTFMWKNGDQYEGVWKDGKPHGKGTFDWHNGTKYVGEWRDGKKHGQGTMTFPDGSRFVGGWKDGKKHGWGTMSGGNMGNQTYEWKDGVIGEWVGDDDPLNEPTEGGNGRVSFDEEGFVLRQDQKSLKYINSKDDIPGRYLYDQEDVTSDYQVHIIYLLAKDSKDKKWDAKGKIQKIVLNSNKKLKKKIKKQFRLDMTKEGKVDVSFVRVDKTKKQIDAGDAATYFSRQIIKNGFYHPKKTYAIFYQDRYQQEWGQVGQGVFITPKGMIEVRTGVTYLGKESLGVAYVPYIHEMIHALGFVQHCAPCREESGTDSHCYLGLDIMSENGDSGKGFSIDKKSNEYYGHSNANCQMDMKKSVFLEPTERDAQLKPRAPNKSECRVSLSQKIYNHERALACLTRLDF